ncbi:PREDICTED: uncharacterized protein C12B10.15c [Nelumbo nucifera]|uniref:Uncharacterized protein n=2 Tax=Nelumbo nucifera TaxID=4432 RepID=A0A822ZGY9_NELNU|nr:PREDICTED: uncharacterized protein C12B10.15c [Nelumbo nucifera]DAD43883.1 TPA_asm: hypothetical protein HUJ06_002113 [Nelumbo nucifera]
MEVESERGLSDKPKNGILGSIDLRSSESVVDLTGQVHQLPCCIKHDGPCPVSQYFKPHKTGVEVEGLAVEEACFRGRKLQGATIPLPEGYCGYVLGKKKNPEKSNTSEAHEGNCWKVAAKFQNIKYWNHDSLPSGNDAFMRCFHWFAVANALHKPVTCDDLASQSTTSERM